MQSIINNYVLVRIDLRTQESTFILQSDNREELQHLKGMLESNIPMDIFHLYQYRIKEKDDVMVS